MLVLATVLRMEELIERALAEDLGGGDPTSAAVVPAGARAVGRIEQREDGVLAGIAVARAVFRHVDPSLRWHAHAREGEWRPPGLVAEVAGPARGILGGERVALNFLQRLSAVATLTARFVRAVEGTGVRIVDTRKTTPGLRALEKAAVLAGGGHAQRAGLNDGILVKENHAALAGGVGAATRAALAAARDPARVQVECATLEELDEALAAGARRILLDNMGLEDLNQAVARTARRAELEASGGVDLHTVRAIAETGVDRISVGALTHSAQALDVALLLDPLGE